MGQQSANSPQEVTRDRFRPTMLNDAVTAFVQVRATFQRQPAKSRTSRKPLSSFRFNLAQVEGQGEDADPIP